MTYTTPPREDAQRWLLFAGEARTTLARAPAAACSSDSPCLELPPADVPDLDPTRAALPTGCSPPPAMRGPPVKGSPSSPGFAAAISRVQTGGGEREGDK
jgi:hypothetical protein